MLLDGQVGKISKEQREYLETIYTGNKRMVELVGALLNVSRLELGTFVVEPEPTDIVKLAISVLDEQKPQSDARKQTVTPQMQKGIPKLMVDPKLLRIVMQNLLSNAIKYTPEGGKIEVAVTKEAKNVLLRVTDTGWGIPKEQHHNIFSKLFRADNVKMRDTEGTGLGLYIAKTIVENSGGKIWFESDENKGTTFYVTLPLSGMKKKTGTKTLS
jgi:signal transduction histidine kinase